MISPSLPHTVQEITATIQEFPKLLEYASRIGRNYLNNCMLESPACDFEMCASSSKETLWNSESIEALPPLSEDSFEILLLNP